MKQRIILLTAFVLMSFSIHQAHASSRATLFLEGTIEVIVDLLVNPVLGSLSAIDIVNGETSRLVATVDETTNNPTGYRIDVETVNGGTLIHNNGTSNTTYTLSYDGGPDLTLGAVGSPSVAKTVTGPFTSTTTDTSNVEVTVAAGGALAAGAYTDTVVFTMVAL